MDDPTAKPAAAWPSEPRAGGLGVDCRAVTALEYGIMAAFFCLALLSIFSKFGGVLTAMFSTATNGI